MPEGDPRDDQIRLRVTATEKQAITAAAKDRRLGVSEYLRRLALGELESPVVPITVSGVRAGAPSGVEGREAFLERRVRELHGRGSTTPVARRLALAEWARAHG